MTERRGHDPDFYDLVADLEPTQDSLLGGRGRRGCPPSPGRAAAVAIVLPAASALVLLLVLRLVLALL